MPLSDIYVCLDKHTITTNPGNWYQYAVVYQRLRLPYVAQVSPYLNNLSKTYTDIYLNIQTFKIRNTNLIHSIIEYSIKKFISENISKYQTQYYSKIH